MSKIVSSLALIPLVCIASFLFYQLGGRFGTNVNVGVTISTSANNNESSLRSNSNSYPTNTETAPIDRDLELSIIDDNIPSCAQEVYLTLHKEMGGDNEHACRGLLVRDDIVVTSHECSKFSFTFDFEGFGLVEAVPHTVLNSREEMVGSRLGFLEARPPYHYYFVGQPSRRTRLFLSHQSTPKPSTPSANVTVNGTIDDTPVVLTCGEQQEPIAHNLPVNGAMVPLGELAEVLTTDDVLWEHIDIDTAPMLTYKHHRWWTKYITLEEEENTIKEMLETYRGPPGSVSIPDAHDKFVAKASALFEAVDPRGHRNQGCFKNYFTRYRNKKTFSGMHFFDWFDFGKGKFLLETNAISRTSHYQSGDRHCYKHDFNKKTLHYFNDEERSKHEIYIKPSRYGKELIARYKHNDEFVPESDMDEPHLYMWDLDEKFYIVDDTWDRDKYGPIKHTAVLQGMPALSAGKAYFGKHGRIWGINFSSGHYRPDIGALVMMYQWMKNSGLNVTALHWVGRTSWSTHDCVKTDWEGIEVPWYNAAELNRSCYEVTTSPTWMLKDDVRR